MFERFLQQPKLPDYLVSEATNRGAEVVSLYMQRAFKPDLRVVRVDSLTAKSIAENDIQLAKDLELSIGQDGVHIQDHIWTMRGVDGSTPYSKRHRTVFISEDSKGNTEDLEINGAILALIDDLNPDISARIEAYSMGFLSYIERERLVPLVAGATHWVRGEIFGLDKGIDEESLPRFHRTLMDQEKDLIREQYMEHYAPLVADDIARNHPTVIGHRYVSLAMEALSATSMSRASKLEQILGELPTDEIQYFHGTTVGRKIAQAYTKSSGHWGFNPGNLLGNS